MELHASKSMCYNQTLCQSLGEGGGGVATRLQANLCVTKSHIVRATQLRSVVSYEGVVTGQS